MSKILIFKSSVFIVIHLISSNLFAQTNANLILKKMDKTIFSYIDKTANVKMVLTNLTSKKEKVKEAILMQKDSNKKLFRYTSPKSDKGIATLSLPNNEIYLYLPLFKKPKKITNLAEKNAFNKSDFSISDMATKSYAEKYSAQIINKDATYYVLELKPKQEKSNYNHIIVYVNKIYFYPERFEYYNHKNQLIKIAKYHYVKNNGLWVADVVSMEDLKKKHKTTISMTNIELNKGLKDEIFTLENLVGTK